MKITGNGQIWELPVELDGRNKNKQSFILLKQPGKQEPLGMVQNELEPM
jgi:hypothetical protein